MYNNDGDLRAYRQGLAPSDQKIITGLLRLALEKVDSLKIVFNEKDENSIQYLKEGDDEIIVCDPYYFACPVLKIPAADIGIMFMFQLSSRGIDVFMLAEKLAKYKKILISSNNIVIPLDLELNESYLEN